MVILDHVNCYCGKTCSMVLLQKLGEQHCPCLCKGIFLSFRRAASYFSYLWYVHNFSCITVQDHYFDVITNVVGLVAAVLGDKFFWWIDPAGAIILAVYTISNWSGTVLENAGIIPIT